MVHTPIVAGLHVSQLRRRLMANDSLTLDQVIARENEGIERDIEGVGWDMSIPLKLFLGLDGNGSLFPQTSA